MGLTAAIRISIWVVQSMTLEINSSSKKKVAILFQLPESWGNVRSVWQALNEDAGLCAAVILLPFIHSDYSWDQQKAEDYLQESGIPYLRWNEIDVKKEGFSAVIFTSPYDATRPLEYGFKELSSIIPCTIYIPYGLEVGGGDENVAMQFCQPAALNSSAVFVRSEAARKMYEKHCPTGAGHVVVSGHPRMDGFYNFDEFVVDPDLLAQIGRRKAVLWNAHFSFDADAWSTFDTLAIDILKTFERKPDIALIFRPHPLLWKKLINIGAFDDSGIVALKDELQRKGVILDERTDHRHAFKASAAMLSDVGTFLMEYLAVGKPALYLLNSDGLGLNEEGEKAVSYYHSASTAVEVSAFLDQISTGADLLKVDRDSAVKELFFGFDGRAGRRVVEHLKAGLLK